MVLTLNGETRELPPGSTLKDVLAILGYDSPRGVAVAVDGNVVPRSLWDGFDLDGGMRVEVLRAVQGG
ncbi:MAG: sulfur carrier protein ThiS [Actinomycetota bacterium]